MREDDWLPIDDAAKEMGRVLLRYPPHYDGGDERIVVGQWVDDRRVKKPRQFWASDILQSMGLKWSRENQPTHYQPIVGPKQKREGE